MSIREYLTEESALDQVPNNNMLTEAGLSRVIQKISQEKNDFAIITAYRDKYSKKENIQRNRELRSQFNKRRMGVYQLVGHWQECSLEDVDYEECPADKLVDVVERSYLVTRPGTMTVEEFRNLIQKLTKEFDQDASLVSLDGAIYLLEPTGKLTNIGSKVSLNKINQAYSQHVKKMNVPFVFEAEVPVTNGGRQLFKINGLRYPDNCDKSELREF